VFRMIVFFLFPTINVHALLFADDKNPPGSILRQNRKNSKARHHGCITKISVSLIYSSAAEGFSYETLPPTKLYNIK